ncbi:Purine or other phosphorylase family 1 [Priestia megaterium WSH-002]|uniref:Purine or other phosphorylase family 1 n=1 Tax=Priestia megaterium (strain WSH-002) TaxID=1006007 RepID=A0A8D4BPJ0_PRIMW|nr:Purine or other phosphorylase family 1 [Priestia megaterium WSH-002]
MKLYGDFEKEDWLNVLKLSEKELPNAFIIHGEWGFQDNISLWKEILSTNVHMPKWNTVIGKFKNRNIGFANVYGSPMASNIVHQFAGSGTDLFIQTGYFWRLIFYYTIWRYLNCICSTNARRRIALVFTRPNACRS